MSLKYNIFTPAASAADPVVYYDTFSPAMGDTDAILSLQTVTPGIIPDHKCTATLIEPTWAITAAHCVDPIPQKYADQRKAHQQENCHDEPDDPSDDVATAGQATLMVRGATKNYQSGGQTAVVIATHIAADWAWFKAGQPGNDLALLELDHPLDITPIPVTTELPPEETWVLVNGWATKTDRCGGITPAMQQWALAVGSCPEGLTEFEVCATTNGAAGPCQGASGGPLLSLVNGTTPTIVGVYSRSWGDYCGHAPGAFTSLIEYGRFITETIAG